MVHHRESEIGAADLAAFGAETGKGLGRGALMDEVAVNVDDRGLAGFFADDVRVPDSSTPAVGGNWSASDRPVRAALVTEQSSAESEKL